MKYPMTEEVAKSERTLPQSLTSLRQKLGQKAKQTVHASGESLQESRMREIRTSGLRRGREISSLPTLPSSRSAVCQKRRLQRVSWSWSRVLMAVG